jgi:hypothetical protein
LVPINTSPFSFSKQQWSVSSFNLLPCLWLLQTVYHVASPQPIVEIQQYRNDFLAWRFPLKVVLHRRFLLKPNYSKTTLVTFGCWFLVTAITFLLICKFVFALLPISLFEHSIWSQIVVFIFKVLEITYSVANV